MIDTPIKPPQSPSDIDDANDIEESKALWRSWTEDLLNAEKQGVVDKSDDELQKDLSTYENLVEVEKRDIKMITEEMSARAEKRESSYLTGLPEQLETAMHLNIEGINYEAQDLETDLQYAMGIHGYSDEQLQDKYNDLQDGLYEDITILNIYKTEDAKRNGSQADTSLPRVDDYLPDIVRPHGADINQQSIDDLENYINNPAYRAAYNACLHEEETAGRREDTYDHLGPSRTPCAEKAQEVIRKKESETPDR